MQNVKTIELTGSETEVRFPKNYPYYWVQNYGDADVFMSLSPNVVPDSDGVIRIPAGSGRSSGDVGQADVLYFIGSGKVEITPQYNAVCPYFKNSGKGGGDGGNSTETDLSGYLTKEAVASSTTVSIADNGSLSVDATHFKHIRDVGGQNRYWIWRYLVEWWEKHRKNSTIASCYFLAPAALIDMWNADSINGDWYLKIDDRGYRSWQLTPIVQCHYEGKPNYNYNLNADRSRFLLTCEDMGPYLVSLDDKNASNNYMYCFSKAVKITVETDLIQYALKTDIPTVSTAYSTAEQIIGTWVDGKPIYQKTIRVELNKANSQTFEHGAENVETVWLNHSATFLRDDTTGASYNYANIGIGDPGAANLLASDYLAWIQKADRQVIVIRQGPSSGITSAYITLNYTKTTD